MAKLTVFNFISLDGYYKGLNDDISWNKHNSEEAEFSAGSLQADNMLLFGRVTYEMMAGFWPTPMAMEKLPKVAAGMNSAEKIVFSTTLKKADWNNTRVSINLIDEVKKLKQTSGKDMTILGSGSILSQLASAGLIDTYQVMINPVAIGAGTPIFKNIKQKLELKLVNTRVFKSGTVLLDYQPMV